MATFEDFLTYLSANEAVREEVRSEVAALNVTNLAQLSEGLATIAFKNGFQIPPEDVEDYFDDEVVTALKADEIDEEEIAAVGLGKGDPVTPILSIIAPDECP